MWDFELTEKYPHLKFIKKADNEADEAGEEVQFWGMILWEKTPKDLTNVDIWFEITAT